MVLPFPAGPRRGWWDRWWVAVVLMASLRLAHLNLLWSDEDYHLAAAIQILAGRIPYLDFWYDKPPLAALFYTLIGGYPGWPLRILDIGFVLVCCSLAYKLAKDWWGENEGRTAALLLAFFTAFYLPSATIPFAVDGLLLLPHLVAIYFATQRKPLWSGFWCAIGLLTNVKAVFIAATCAAWMFDELPLFAAGLAAPLAIAAVIGAWLGILPAFYRQVWEWGLIYARGSPSANPLGLALKHTADWMGFHIALLVGLVLMFVRQTKASRLKMGIWLLMSFTALLFGNHFAPRYFFQLLPVMVIAGARGVVLAATRYGLVGQTILALLLLVPLVRFGPRYADLFVDEIEHRQTHWSDAALDVDSQRAAAVIDERKQTGDTLFVWGYRPDMYVYTRLEPPGKFWDSQPLDGVPADRHLESSAAILTGPAQENRDELIRSQPTFIVDGLGLLNPALSPEKFPEINAWLQHYRLIGTTPLSRVYERIN